MTYLATVTIATDTDTTRLLTDAPLAGTLVTLFGADGVAITNQTVTVPTAAFPGLADGTYSVIAVSVDADGHDVGSPARADFTAGGGTVPTSTTVKTVSAISVTVTAE